VLVEGAGGLMSPLSDEDYVADLAYEFGYPLVIVAANQLGVINQTLQTLIAAAAFGEGIEIAGVVLNEPRHGNADPSTATNAAELQKRSIPPILGCVPHGGSLTAPIDWLALSQPQSD
jgi:dethiobiotin synthetase